MEVKANVSDISDANEGSVRRVDEYKVNPQIIRNLTSGQAIVYNTDTKDCDYVQIQKLL